MRKKGCSKRWGNITNDEHIRQVEALLFASGGGIKIETMMDITGFTKAQILDAIDHLTQEYKQRNSSIIILPEGESYKMAVAEKYLTHVHKINPHTELTRQVLETLAVIAWKQPVLQSEVIHIRTSAAYEHIGELVDKGFVTKEVSGRSFLLKLTQKFYDYFDLPDQARVRDLFKDVANKGEAQSTVVDFEEQPKLGSLEVYDAEGKTSPLHGLETYEGQMGQSPAVQPHEATIPELYTQKFSSQETPKTTSPATYEPSKSEEEQKREELKNYQIPPRDDEIGIPADESTKNPQGYSPAQSSYQSQPEAVRSSGDIRMEFSGPIMNSQGPEPMGVQDFQQRTTADLIRESDVPDILEEGETVADHEAVKKRVNEILQENEKEDYEFEGDSSRIHLGPYPVEQAKYELEGVKMNKRESKLLDELTQKKNLSFMTERTEEDEEGEKETLDEESEVEHRQKQIEAGHSQFKERKE